MSEDLTPNVVHEPSNFPLLGVGSPTSGRLLLTLRRVDDRLVAEYDPADLDEAAKVFAEAVTGFIVTKEPRP